jgi:AI-2 transport protein TqsA
MAKQDGERADRRVQTICLLILTLIASATALALLRPVLVPFILALFFTYSLSPIVDFQMRRWKLRRPAAILGAAVVGLAVVALLGLIIATNVSTMSHRLDAYQMQFAQLNHRISQSTIWKHFGIKPDTNAGEMFFAIPENATFTLVSAVLGGTTNFITESALVVIFAIFILLGRSDSSAQPSALLAEIENRVKRYIGQTVFFSALTGLLVAITLWALGVEFAGVFGFLAFLLNFIPSVGAVVATLLPIPIVLLSPNLSPTAKVLAVALPGAIEFIIGNLVQPKVQGGSLQLHPVVVLMSLIFFGMIWGIVGAFLATPIAGAIKIIFERIEMTRPLAEIMSGDLSGVGRRFETNAAKEALIEMEEERAGV